MPTIVCPHCGYAGGPDYKVREGFNYAELCWNYFTVEGRNGKLEVTADSLNTDPEQEPRERKIECGGCGDLFDIPDGLELEWV